MWGMVDHDWAMARAVARRMPRSRWVPVSIHPSRTPTSAPATGDGAGGSAGGSAGAGVATSGWRAASAQACTSSARMRWPGPVPVSWVRSTPSSAASRRVDGEALGRRPG